MHGCPIIARCPPPLSSSTHSAKFHIPLLRLQYQEEGSVADGERLLDDESDEEFHDTLLLQGEMGHHWIEPTFCPRRCHNLYILRRLQRLNRLAWCS